jgi:alkylation response protein AidB-like acyl-CoA dehydrogenase
VELEPGDEQRELVGSLRTLLEREGARERVRRAEPFGFDGELWRCLASLGIPALGVPAVAGGNGGSMVDLALVAGTAGSYLVPAPVVEDLVCARLLARVAPDVLAAGVLDGSRIATTALHPASLQPVSGQAGEGTPPTAGPAQLVPAGAVAGVVSALVDGELVVVERPYPADPPASPANLGSSPLAEVDLAGGRVVASGDGARMELERAVREWKVCTAAALCGLGRAALEAAVAYVREREQFGSRIGSFQAVQHPLADSATELEGARLLALEAAWALDERIPRAAALSSMAFAFAAEVAERAAGRCLHFHGGYGYTLEQDAQLYYRRAKAWPLQYGAPGREHEVLADALYGPAGSATGPAGTATGPAGTATGAGRASSERSGPRSRGLDFDLGGGSEELRERMRSFLDAHLTEEVLERAARSGTLHDRGLHRALGREGWLAAAWPEELGGGGRDPLEMAALSEELALRGAPVDGWAISELVANVLRTVCPGAHAEIVKGILAGEVVCCLGYSEPGSGSDVAAARTRAVREGGEWVLNGQKIFTTLAEEAQYVFLLARTSSEGPKHRGLTTFLVPMGSPGIEIRPIETLGGERTNMTFYDEVRVPDSLRVGEVGGGWEVMKVALAFERQPTAAGEAMRLQARAEEWASSKDSGGRRPLDDPAVRTALARTALRNEVSRLLAYRMSWSAARGRLPVVEGSMAKLFSSESYVRSSSELLGAAGPRGLLRHGEHAAAADGWIEHSYRHAVVTTIYAGTSEIQRSVIAEQGLGLPRSR